MRLRSDLPVLPGLPALDTMQLRAAQRMRFDIESLILVLDGLMQWQACCWRRRMLMSGYVQNAQVSWQAASAPVLHVQTVAATCVYHASCINAATSSFGATWLCGCMNMCSDLSGDVDQPLCEVGPRPPQRSVAAPETAPQSNPQPPYLCTSVVKQEQANCCPALCMAETRAVVGVSRSHAQHT